MIYIHRSVSFAELTALYSVSDVCLLTSRRDGMNLVASEYVACQEARHGVLVLSEFTGASIFMKRGSLLFNPFSADSLLNALYEAVTMEKEDRKKMYEELRNFVTTNTRLVVSFPSSSQISSPVIRGQVPRVSLTPIFLQCEVNGDFRWGFDEIAEIYSCLE